MGGINYYLRVRLAPANPPIASTGCAGPYVPMVHLKHAQYLTLFHMIGVFKDPRMTNLLIIFNRFYIDANMFRHLHQHNGW